MDFICIYGIITDINVAKFIIDNGIRSYSSLHEILLNIENVCILQSTCVFLENSTVYKDYALPTYIK
jgi:hypothetical protein